MHSSSRREDQHEPKPAQYRHPSLDYEDPPYLFAYPRQPAFLPTFASVPPTNVPYVYFLPPVPPVIGPIQVEGGTWWYVPGHGQSPQQPYTVLAPPAVQQPFNPSQSPPSAWTTPQQPSSPPPSSSSSSFSGPFSRARGRIKPRRTYPPNPPATRSGWVMWVGNVPHNAKHDELWRFFTHQPYVHVYHRTPASETENANENRNKNRNEEGVLSIFLISRSRCAFVNYESEGALQRAIRRFDGVHMYAADASVGAACLVCRVRANGDDLCVGMGGGGGGGKGRGVHVEWVRKQAQAQASQSDTERPPLHSSDSSSSLASNASTPASNASTSSIFLEAHFPQRFFILKSFTQANINTSVTSGLWATQRHNEPILDQAFRTAKDVFLIFSVNKSGGFCGFARMQGAIGNDGEPPGGGGGTSSVLKNNHSPMVPGTSPEPVHPNVNTTHTNSLLDTSDSIQDKVPRRSDSAPIQTLLSLKYNPTQAGAVLHYHGHDISSETSNTHLTHNVPLDNITKDSGSRSHHLMDKVPLDNLTQDAASGEGWGRTHFKLQWLSTVHIPFQQTHHIRNLWNGNREVKISHDGTEVETEAGWALLGVWTQ